MKKQTENTNKEKRERDTMKKEDKRKKQKTTSHKVPFFLTHVGKDYTGLAGKGKDTDQP